MVERSEWSSGLAITVNFAEEPRDAAGKTSEPHRRCGTERDHGKRECAMDWRNACIQSSKDRHEKNTFHP